MHGLRKQYINAFGYFAISLTLTGLYAFLTRDRFSQLMTIAKSISKKQIEVQQDVLDITFQYQSVINLGLVMICICFILA
nr:hypothetical protein [Aquimarina sp. I32.4]